MKSTCKQIAALLLVLGLVFTASQALANVAANTEIVNSARLTFDGGSANASVTVTVALVPSQPNVTITNASGAYTAPNTPALTNSVRITSTANGPAEYTVAPSVDSSVNATDPTVTGGTTVTIGASVTTGTSGTTFVTVPAGGASGNNAAVNGIGVNDTIVFTVNGNAYTRQITATTDNGDGTFRLSWSGAIPGADVPGSGVQVGEEVTVNLSVLPGTVNAAGSAIAVTVQAVVSTDGGAVAVTVSNSAPNTWSTPSPNVSMTKYVRNLNDSSANPGAGTGTTITVNTVTREYFTAGVIGKPGDTLEYIIVANNSGGADLTGCAIADLVPVAYVDFKTGVYGGNDVFYVDPAGASFTFTTGAVGANQASFVAGNDPNLIVNVGTGASNVLTGAIAGGGNVTVAYQVTIK